MLLTVQVDGVDGDQLVQFRNLTEIWAVRKTWVGALSIFSRRRVLRGFGPFSGEETSTQQGSTGAIISEANETGGPDIFETPRSHLSETIAEEPSEGDEPESEVKQQETGSVEVKESKVEDVDEEQGDEEKAGVKSPLPPVPEVEREASDKTDKSPLRSRSQVGWLGWMVMVCQRSIHAMLISTMYGTRV